MQSNFAHEVATIIGAALWSGLRIGGLIVRLVRDEEAACEKKKVPPSGRRLGGCHNRRVNPVLATWSGIGFRIVRLRGSSALYHRSQSPELLLNFESH